MLSVQTSGLLRVLGVALAVSCGHAPPPPAPAGAEPNVVFDQSGPFGRVLVRDEGPLRVMRFGTPPGAEQSAIVRERPGAVPIEYVRYALLGLGHAPQVHRVLMIGLGGGTFTTLLHRALPDVGIDAVEIDPTVVAAARCCFGLREDDRYRVHVADAATWLAGDTGHYDYVFLDAYAGEDIPAAIASPAFFAAVRAHLAPGGVVAINIAEPARQHAAIAAALAPALTIFECRRARRDGNLVIYASAAPRAADPAALLRFADGWDARRVTDFSLRALALAATGTCTTSTTLPGPGSTSP
jgi:predicted O-methyltransferase YrrM